MKYIFPRQFGLQNVFKPESDGRNSTFNLKPTLFREKEISQLEHHKHLGRHQPGNEFEYGGCAVGSPKVPKRLRGIIEIVKKLRNRHGQCCYGKLLRHYCPTKVRRSCFVTTSVSLTFCRRPDRQDSVHSLWCPAKVNPSRPSSQI